jgi:NAD(P)-dependent dehydrogenase (short-subunit alcohol dehydrogenase family)
MVGFWYWYKRRTPSSFKPVILITGCGSGIGLALARLLFSKTEYRIVATARESSIASLRAEFLESDRFIVRALDVTDEGQRKYLVDELTKLWGGINVLVNNAGISYRSVIEHMTEEDEYKQMATNYFGPMGLIRLVLPDMRAKGRGKIINVSSVSGMLAMPTMASYSASKYALEGASEALWYETKPLGIGVTLVQPGFIHSASFQKVYYSAKSRIGASGDGPYSDYYQNMAPFVAKLMNMSVATPEKIALLIHKVIKTENPPLWVAATFDALLFYYIRRMLPRRMLLQVLFFALPGARQWAHTYTKKRQG